MGLFWSGSESIQRYVYVTGTINMFTTYNSVVKQKKNTAT